MKAVIYARYSSDKQNPGTIKDQVRNCKAFAKDEGWKIGDIYTDEAISGTKKNRPDYQRMLKDAEAKRG